MHQSLPAYTPPAHGSCTPPPLHQLREHSTETITLPVRGGATCELALQLSWLANPSPAAVAASVEYHGYGARGGAMAGGGGSERYAACFGARSPLDEQINLLFSAPSMKPDQPHTTALLCPARSACCCCSATHSLTRVCVHVVFYEAARCGSAPPTPSLGSRWAPLCARRSSLRRPS